MTHRFGILRRFRFNLPQRIAAGLLAAFLLQGLWVTAHQTLTDRDYQYARCGRETWERPSALAGYYTTCGNIHDGILAYRLAGLPLTLNFIGERVRLTCSASRKTAWCSRQTTAADLPADRSGRRAEHLGAAPPDDPHPAAVAAAVPAGGLRAGRMPLVGHAAALRQPGRLYGAGALLLLPRDSARLPFAQSRGAGCAGRLRRRLHLPSAWPMPCRVRAASGGRASSCS